MVADGAETSRLFELRSAPTRHLAGQADAVAAACHAMAVRFHRGGKLVVFGTGGSSTDAQHVAVEFVHPVIVGKRALPAISLTTDVATVTGIAERAGVATVAGTSRTKRGFPSSAGKPMFSPLRCPTVNAVAPGCVPICVPVRSRIAPSSAPIRSASHPRVSPSGMKQMS